MLIDARSISPGDTVQTDLCIVGAGPAGITIAQEFVDHPSRVILLEGGGTEFREASQNHYEGVCVGRPYYPLHTCRFRFLGGSTNYWGGWCRPLDAIDFEERDWVPYGGWPFRKQKLQLEYRRAHVICNLKPCQYEESKNQQESSLLPDDSGAFSDTLFQIGATRFGKMYRERLRNARNVCLILNANVLEVETDQAHRSVKLVRVATCEGNRFAVSASLFVLAAGGIENPRILLASRRARACGVGNENDLVGRFFADHLHVPLGMLAPIKAKLPRFYQVHKVDGFAFRGAISLTDQHRRSGRRLGFGVTLHNADDPHDVLVPAENHQGYSSLMFLAKSISRGECPDQFGRRMTNILSNLDNTLILSYRRLVKPRPRRWVLGCRAEQTPNRESRVALDDRKDRFGMPRARLDWRLATQDLDSLREAKRLLASEFSRASLGIISFEGSNNDEWINNIAGAAHHMGTTRMHRDPRLGVVDENCRIHGISNLYVAGSSVFPSSGWAPPTLTIVALALRLADRFKLLLR